MRRFVLTILLAGTIVIMSSAQDYKTGLGVRIGTANGLTIKHFLNGRSAVEGMLTTRWHGFDITGLYEIHNPAFDVVNLKWFYGFGGHLGFYDGQYVEWGEPGSTYNVIGIDGIIGLEYTLEDAPVSFGVDLKPTLNFIGYSGLWADFGLSVRYNF